MFKTPKTLIILSFFLLLNVPETFQQEAPAKPVAPEVVNDLGTAMQAEKIIPDLLSSVPKETLQVQYLPGTVVHLGNELMPSKVRDAPRKVIWTPTPNKLYTLMFLDLDSPSRTTSTYRSVLNWLIVNVPGTDISKGDLRAEYIGAAPAQNTGLHRLVFLVLEQNAKISVTGSAISKRTHEGRFSFNLANFIKTNNLISSPVAGNFFVSRFDNYVPILQGQLGLNRR